MAHFVRQFIAAPPSSQVFETCKLLEWPTWVPGSHFDNLFWNMEWCTCRTQSAFQSNNPKRHRELHFSIRLQGELFLILSGVYRVNKSITCSDAWLSQIIWWIIIIKYCSGNVLSRIPEHSLSVEWYDDVIVVEWETRFLELSMIVSRTMGYSVYLKQRWPPLTAVNNKCPNVQPSPKLHLIFRLYSGPEVQC